MTKFAEVDGYEVWVSIKCIIKIQQQYMNYVQNKIIQEGNRHE